MSISLFPHNQTAYEALLTTLETERRACIIHPTGTGKSFIGFKYCEDHPEKAVLWLSPSEYIFKTQCESLTATGTEMPENISFMTYAKLSILEQAELDALHPDVVILDEMHRAAAPTWEKPVQTLLSQNPVVIGLTATHIRYLDGQKDTTETFNMNVASEMTLGEAIALGILNPPRYVLSVYSYQNELEAYAKRIRRARNTAVRDAANEVFEALRRAIEKADGLDDIFSRHMTERHGKYLVFCSHVEHLDEMMSKVPEWFAKVDDRPHVYRAYADDPGTSKAFAAFKADQSEHLKLLFCIDMLNEGIHVDNVDGVILLRPTIYAEENGNLHVPPQFKADGIWLAKWLNEQRQIYIGNRPGKRLTEDQIRRLDEIGMEWGNRSLLNKKLAWEEQYTEAKRFFEKNGHLSVPGDYRGESGKCLSVWILRQREANRKGKLTEKQRELLDEIGMQWELDPWERGYEHAEQYYREHGNLNVPAGYTSEDGYKLGKWLSNQKANLKSGDPYRRVSPEQKKRLDALGIIWDSWQAAWEEGFRHAAPYLKELKGAAWKTNYVSPDGYKTGSWLRSQLRSEQKGRLTPEKKKLLEEIGLRFVQKEEGKPTPHPASAFERTAVSGLQKVRRTERVT